MPRVAALALALALAFAACSSNSGAKVTGDHSTLDQDAYLDQLSPDEKRTLCTWDIAQRGGAGTFQCPQGEVTVPTVDECVADAGWPHCKVSTWEDCTLSVNGMCGHGPTPECDDYQNCKQLSPGLDYGVVEDLGAVDSGTGG